MSKEYIQIAFDFSNQDQFDRLVAELSELGFEGFNEEELEDKSYFKETFIEELVKPHIDKILNSNKLTVLLPRATLLVFANSVNLDTQAVCYVI